MTDMPMIAPNLDRLTQSGRMRLLVRGAVQGVGFRPYVHRLATSLKLTGFVRNVTQGVHVEVEGRPDLLREFLRRFPSEVPRPARPERIESTAVEPTGSLQFRIDESENCGSRTAIVLHDIATCVECLAEVFNPADRRFRYPFTNCMHCGPRFSIIDAIPYDRPSTSMRCFQMCPACRAEYDEPANRRFHAQPNACSICGPHLTLRDDRGTILATHDDALIGAAEAIRGGRITAVKGIGGFHLIVDGRDEAAVQRLRVRKCREEKPFAMMFPDMASVRAACEVSAEEEELLRSPTAPIVLLRRRGSAADDCVAGSVATDNPYLGVMLPYSPLHHLLMRELRFAIVATSGNRCDEPICTDNDEALRRLADIADVFLVHNRPIVRHVDDSVMRVVLGRELVLRRARGLAPLPISMHGVAERPASSAEPILAVGAHQKNSIALTVGDDVFISQHIGDLETPEAFEAFVRAGEALQRLYAIRPRIVACDLHPDYSSTQFAGQIARRPIAVQHHHAHIVACMAEHDLHDEVLGICWDGSGYGPDGTIWGGEFLRATREAYRRIAHLRPFALPGGTQAVREPRRSAFGALYETFGRTVCEMDDLAPVRAFPIMARKTLMRMMDGGTNSPRTSSAGRLFDAVAALLDLRQSVSHEGQAAMALEFAADDLAPAPLYPFDLIQNDANVAILDWTPLIRAIVADLRDGATRSRIAGVFHKTLIEMILAVVEREKHTRIVLTGGCFQNVTLLTGAVKRLCEAGCQVYWPRQIPPNDGGICVGQAVVAAEVSRNREAAACA